VHAFPADDPPSEDVDTPAELPAALNDEDARLERSQRDAAERIELIQSEADQEDEALGRQRRQNVRVDVHIPLTIRMSGRDAPGRTRDVSATGVGFSTRLPVEMDQRGEVTIEFDDGWNFTKAVVIRFIKPILAGNVIGAQFEKLSADERERLVKQVFDVQRRQLKTDKQR
jgi:c-di-GMP-binding flagellar brake protein YcgR